MLDRLKGEIERRKLGVKNVRVLRHGETVGRLDFAPEKAAPVWSVSKTFTAMAAGVAMDEGYFGLDEPANLYLPEMGAYDITVRNLLRMATGHAECPLMRAVGAGEELDDLISLFANEPCARKQGEKFVYDNLSFYVISRLIEKVSGQTLDEFLYECVLSRMGFVRPVWDTCPRGHATSASISRSSEGC
jgi:CubicO group peptidase (beta-lactamase class C family)